MEPTPTTPESKNTESTAPGTSTERPVELTVNATKVLERRYLRRAPSGELIETPAGMFGRVAHVMAEVERDHGTADPGQIEDAFYQLMTGLEFLPNSPTLMNAGTPIGQLSACFVIPVADSMASIFDAIRTMALIHQSGGGTGFSFSRLRPRGDRVQSTMGIASGPVSFMRIFDTAADVIKQGGRRRGANMGILAVDHPDILEFIEAKHQDGMLDNFNISVAVTDAFMDAVEHDRDYALVNPRTGAPMGQMSARHVFELIVAAAWATGDPGLVFIESINRANPTPNIGVMEATNPCGELPLLPYESCNLGSINLARMVRGQTFDWDKLRRVVHLAVRFLDNVIDANHYPLDGIARMTLGNRKLGLGVMGFADALVLLNVPYNSDQGLAIAEQVMAFIHGEAQAASQALAAERGAFPNFAGSVYDHRQGRPMRNATVTSIAPTGTISIIAGCSSGIEPLFALSYVRNVMEGMQLVESNAVFERAVRARGLFSRELMAAVAQTGSVRDMDSVPEDIKRVFVTDFDIAPAWHVRMQAAFQRHCDNAVSKTVNLPERATLENVRDTFLLAHKLGCKGITVFRYGCKRQQVLSRGDAMPQGVSDNNALVHASSEYAGGCPYPGCEF